MNLELMFTDNVFLMKFSRSPIAKKISIQNCQSIFKAKAGSSHDAYNKIID